MKRLKVLASGWMLFIAATASGQAMAPGFRFGADALTFDYVRDTVRFQLRHGGEVPAKWFEKWDDGEILKLLAEGKLDAGSVLVPVGSGMEVLDKVGKEAGKRITVLPVGRVGVWVVVGGGRKIEQMSVKQLGEILSGKINTWGELGAGEGRIVIACDETALSVACQVADVARPKKLDDPRWKVDVGTHGASTASAMGGDAWDRQHAIDAKLPRSAGKTDDYLLLASAAKLLPQGGVSERAIRPIGVTAGAGKAAVGPSVKTMEDGSYPLALEWRLVVRPDAAEQVQGAVRICQRAYEGQLLNSQSVKEWLIEGPRSDQPGVVRVFFYGGKEALTATEEAYGRGNKEAQFADVSTVEKSVGAAFAERADLLVVVGRLYDDHRKEMVTLCGGELEEHVVGQQPVLLVVGQACGVTEVTLEQAQHVASNVWTEWKELGWDCARPVARHSRGLKFMEDGFFGGTRISQKDRRPAAQFNPKGHTEEESRKLDRELAGLANWNYWGEADLLTAVAKDKYSIGFVPASDSALASGLKILKVGAKGAGVEATAANVLAGKYPAVRPVSVLVHPKAGAAARKYVAWLESPAGAEVLAKHYIYSQALKTDAQVAAGATSQGAPVAPAGAMAGAVAVLPTEMLSPYFMVAGDAHREAYADVIAREIAADGRLKVVDREHLGKVWQERQYALLTGQQEFKPAVSADVFVVPAIVQNGAKNELRVTFLHGPTASVLEEVRVVIDPADPLRFEPPLGKVVSAGWERALGKLAAARSRPSWAVAGVYAETTEGLAAAGAMEERLRGMLRKNPQVMLSETVDLDAAQNEALMAMLGAGRAVAGGFRGDADFIIEGKLEAGQVALRVLDGRSLALVGEGSFAADGAEMDKWVGEQTRKARRDGAAGAAATNWGSKQAKLEFKIAGELAAQMKTLTAEAERRRIVAGREKICAEDTEALSDLVQRRHGHLTRAMQLDPNNEEFGLVFAASFYYAKNELPVEVRRAQLYERLARQFPNSKAHRSMMENAIAHYGGAVRNLSKSRRLDDSPRVPRGIDHARLRLVYLGKVVELYESYAARYVECFDKEEEERGSNCSFPGLMMRYPYYAARYSILTKADEAETGRRVAQWASIMDKRPEAGPGSDFLKLAIIELRNDRAGYLELLNDMQRRHPDSKDVYWEHGGGAVQSAMYRLFGTDSDRCSFTKWRLGRRGIGDLPYVGYDAATDTSKPGWVDIE